MVIQPYYEKNDAHTSREALHPILAMRSNQYSNYCKEEGIEAKERTPSPKHRVQGPRLTFYRTRLGSLLRPEE